MTHFSESAVNIRWEVFKDISSSLSVNTVSIPPANVVKAITTPTYQYTNSACKHAFVEKPVFSTSHVNSSSDPVVVIINSSLPLHVCDVPVRANLLCYFCKVSPPIPLSANVTTTLNSHALIIKFPHFHLQLTH